MKSLLHDSDDRGYSAVEGAMDKIKLREPLNTMPAWLQSTTGV